MFKKFCFLDFDLLNLFRASNFEFQINHFRYFYLNLILFLSKRKPKMPDTEEENRPNSPQKDSAQNIKWIMLTDIDS